MGTSLRERLLALVRRFAGRRILVVGDMVADEYITGIPLKISREAPVLVLRHNSQTITPGGALNPGMNARTLGAEVYLAGVVGDDALGTQLRAQLSEYGVHLDGLFSVHDRPTSAKTRVLAGDSQLIQQQIVRIDRIDDSELGPDLTQRITGYLREVIPDVDALIISDYENGVISPTILDATLTLAQEHGKIVVADSHGDLARFQRVTALTPNQPEAETTLGWPITDAASLEIGGRRLLDMTGAQVALITRGGHGMSLFPRDDATLHLPAINSGVVVDPTGAGDTVAATFALALAIDGATNNARIPSERLVEAAVLANLAAGLVVRHVGCATNTPQELADAIRAHITEEVPAIPDEVIAWE